MHSAQNHYASYSRSVSTRYYPPHLRSLEPATPLFATSQATLGAPQAAGQADSGESTSPSSGAMASSLAASRLTAARHRPSRRSPGQKKAPWLSHHRAADESWLGRDREARIPSNLVIGAGSGIVSSIPTERVLKNSSSQRLPLGSLSERVRAFPTTVSPQRNNTSALP